MFKEQCVCFMQLLHNLEEGFKSLLIWVSKRDSGSNSHRYKRKVVYVCVQVCKCVCVKVSVGMYVNVWESVRMLVPCVRACVSRKSIN